MAKHAKGLYHMDIKVHSRAKGADVAKLMAYRAGATIVSHRTGRRHAYSRKREVAYSAIALPDGASPEWNDRRKLANAIEAVECRRDAQLVREIEVALPRDLSFDQQVSLLHHFVQRVFVAEGMVASFDIHSKPGNPHCHILLSLRAVTPVGFGVKVRAWNEHSLAETWREKWAISCNAALRLAGSTSRVDHRSYKRRGLDMKPTVHLGTRRIGNAEKWDARAEGNELILGRRQIRDARSRHRQLDQELERNQQELLDAVVQESWDAMAGKPHKHGPTVARQRQQGKAKTKGVTTRAAAETSGYGSP
jgi:ATP-dependent exoDNAse (exonuclease V) alpha subunit